jgi:hypothetical protein
VERARVAAELSLHVVRKTFKERKERGEWVGRFRPTICGKERRGKGKGGVACPNAGTHA